MVPYRAAWSALALFVLLPAVTPAAEIDRLVPADTEMVLVVNVRQTLDAPAFKKHFEEQTRATLKQNDELQRLLEAVALDLFKDVNTLTLSLSGASTDKAFLIARGAFNLERAHATADLIAHNQPNALKIHKEGEVRVYEGRGPGATFYLAFLDKETMVLSPTRGYVADAIKGAGRKEAQVGKELKALVAGIDGKQNVWMAGVFSDALKKELGRNEQVAEYTRKLVAFSGGTAVGNDLQTAIQIQTTDARAAADVASLLDGLKGFAAAAVEDQPVYGPLLSALIGALQVANQKSAVTLTGKLGPDAIEKAVKKGPK